MPVGLGNEVIWLCPSLDDAGNDTGDVTNFGNLGTDAYITGTGTPENQWIDDTDEGGIRAIASANGIYVRIDTPSGVTSASDFSITMWINATNLSQTQNALYLEAAAAGSDTRNYLSVFSDGRLFSDQFLPSGGWLETDPGEITTGSWIHVGYRQSGTTESLWINGVNVAERTGSVELYTGATTTHCRVGSRQGATQYLAGNWDDLRLFDRAISDDEFVMLSSKRGFQLFEEISSGGIEGGGNSNVNLNGVVSTTIGTSSRDYSTITLWEADLDNDALYASGLHAEGLCYNDSVFNETFNINGGTTIGLTSTTLTVAAGERHDGTAGTGARVVRSAIDGFYPFAQTTNIARTLSWLEFTRTPVGTGVGLYLNTPVNAVDHTVSHCIFHDVTNTLGGNSDSITLSGSGTPVYVHDNIVYGLHQTGSVSGTVAAGIHLLQQPVVAKHLYNNTIYDCTHVGTNANNSTYGIFMHTDDVDNNIKNNVAGGISSASGVEQSFYPATTANTIASNNASDDVYAPGSDSITGITPANEFVSIVGGSEDLHLVLDSTLAGAGTDISASSPEAAIDINGIDRTDSGRWSIGAHEGAATITTTIGTSARDYSTLTLWEADLDSTSVYLPGDIAIGECYNDSVFNEAVTINGGTTVGLTSATLTAAVGERHDGTAGTGARNVRTSAGGAILTISTTGSTSIHASWLELNVNGNNHHQIVNCSATTGPGYDTILSNMICHGHGDGSNPVWGNNGVHITNANESVPSRAMNCIIYDVESTNTGGNNGLLLAYDGTEATNITVYGITNPSAGVGYGIRQINGTNASRYITNSVAAGCETAFSIGSVPSSYNASDDGTASGTGSITGITAANEFVSIVGGAEDLHLVLDSTLAGVGTDVSAVSGSEIDINGTDRTLSGRWSIGAHEGPQTITTSIGTNARDYSTITLWEADLDDASIYVVGDAAVGECYNDSAFSGQHIVDGGTTIGLSKIHITAAIGERHDGTAGTGARIVATGTVSRTITLNSPPIDGEISWLEGDWNGFSTAGDAYGLMLASGVSGSIHHCIIHGSRSTGANSAMNIRAYGTGSIEIHNNIAYNASVTQTTRFARNIFCDRATNGGLIYNNTCYKTTAATAGNAYGISLFNGNHFITNNICTDNDVDFQTGSGTQTYSYNASEDATAIGTGSITDIITADQFVSIVEGSEDLHLKITSDSIRAGIDLSASGVENIEIDIDGFDRTTLTSGLWSIGADDDNFPEFFVEIADGGAELGGETLNFSVSDRISEGGAEAGGIAPLVITKNETASGGAELAGEALNNVNGVVVFTIGTNSRDYSTIALWESDLDNAALYSPGLQAEGRCYNDSVFNEQVTINGGGTIGLTHVTLTAAEGERHNGTAGTGARIIYTGGGFGN